MSNQVNKILCVLQGIFFIFLIAFISFKVRSKAHALGHKIMCEEMNKDLYEDPGKDFLKNCIDQFSPYLSYKNWEINMNSWLGGYGLSHFAVYRPSKTKELWESTLKETGAKFKRIEKMWVAIKVHQNSPFKKGDVVLSINNNTRISYEDVHKQGGIYKIKRQDKKKIIEVDVKEYRWEDGIKFINPNILVVPSFRKEFFVDKAFIDLLKKADIKENKQIVIDLRSNYGGNMGAGLEFLSYFFCKPVTVGYIQRERSKEGESFFPETLDDLHQMEQLTKYQKLKLKTFKRDYCTDKKVKVVIDSSTSSTAELVAQAFYDLERGVLVGQPTSGQLVLSRWNELKNFPEGFSYSYPVAIYKTLNDVVIEGFGVYPDIIKKYNLDYESKGIDSFLRD